MIHLMIDGQRVNLAEDISFEFYARNPFFTSEGEHTMDIEISLADPQNAIIYGNMQRMDVGKRPTGRSAVLWHEKGVIIRGTEVVLEIEEKSVKIQIVAGNSEFNYITGNDTYIRDLDLGKIETLDNATALASMRGSYPAWDYVCAPVCNKVTFHHWAENVMRQGTVSYNDSTIFNEIEGTDSANAQKYKSGTRLCPQPYLAAIVRRILEALGYEVTVDFIGSHKELSRLIIVHGHDTLKYNMMVENWKVGDFFTQVENLCGVYFVVDNNAKTVEIMTSYAYYATAETEEIQLSDVIGDIDKKYDEEPPTDLLYNNVSYKFPKTNLCSLYSIDPDLMKKIKTETCFDTASVYPAWNTNLYKVWHHIIGDDSFTSSKDAPQAVYDLWGKLMAFNVFTLKSEKSRPYPFILAVCSTTTKNNVCLKMINQFGPRINEEKSDNMEISIVPAEIIWCYRTGGSKGYFIYPLPLAENTDSEEPSSSNDTFQVLSDRIRNGENSESTSDTMFVAFYVGLQNDNFGKGYVTPTTLTSKLLDYTHAPYLTDSLFWQNQEIRDFELDGDYELSINSANGMYEKYWSKQVEVNADIVYVIKFRSLKMRDARHIFNIGNRKFYCQQLKYDVVDGHLSDVIEGTFYPLD